MATELSPATLFLKMPNTKSTLSKELLQQSAAFRSAENEIHQSAAWPGVITENINI